MSETSYGRAVEIIEEVLETKNTSLCGISDIRIHALKHKEQIGGNVTLSPGKYARAELTIFIGPL